jgi:hypothetical protein
MTTSRSVRRRRLAALLVAAVALAAAVAPSPAQARFKIIINGTFLGAVAAHGEDPTAIHEDITATAIRSVLKNANPTIILNVQRGVENTDVTHQWDAEYHFDNSSVAGNVGFEQGFDTVAKHFKAAVKNAKDNPQFLRPRYPDFARIATAAALELRQAARSRACEGGCPEALIDLAEAIEKSRKAGIVPSLAEKVFSFAKGRDNLVRNPFPDPHAVTGERSVFSTITTTGCGFCGLLGPVNEGYRDIITTVEQSVEKGIAQSRRHKLPALRRQLLVLRDAIDAYRAFQDLGHAFHASQDFFAHTNYVELMAGVEVEQPIPAGTQIAISGKFNLAGLREIMGEERYLQLESGAVFTNWLGEGDFCAGPNPFNPDAAIVATLPGWLAQGAALVLGGGIEAGQNALPPPPFHYCHYHTPGAAGLNKDEPKADEPSHVNHAAARDAATRFSSILWEAFLVSIDADPRGGSSEQRWSGQWDFKHTVSGLAGGFAFRHETDDNGADLLERIGGTACSGETDYFAGGFTVPDDEALPPGESFVDTGKIRGCTVLGKNHLVGRYQSNRSPDTKGDIDLTLDASGRRWKGTFTVDGSPQKVAWTGTFDEHFEGDGANEPSD